MSEVVAPDPCGLAPADARRVCYGRDLGLTIDVADMVEVSGWDPSCVRVTEQWPSPGSHVNSTTVVVRIDVFDGGDEAGVREPRRPSPSPSSPGVAPDDESALEGDGH
jgi:hypothetical protein